MGRISLGEDTLLGREVAIKELLVPNPELAARFQRELALTARLQHPSIVSIHDGGHWPGGEPFYVMNLVRGHSLDAAVAARATPAQRLELLAHGVAVVEALAYAHGQRVIHRDLKPANILVGSFGETVVIDWGLAKDLRGGAHEDREDAVRPSESPLAPDGATERGAVLGTPAFMAPEQARGAALDERADVYALGAVLYYLLSGRPPLQEPTVSATLAKASAGAVVPLATVAPDLPRDLTTIVAKAMASRPEDRYPDAGALAVDLRRFQGGQLVGAHAYSSRELLRRWLRVHRKEVVVAGVALSALVVIGAISVARVLREEARADHQRALAQARGADAEELMNFMVGDFRDKLEPLGQLALLESPARKALAYFERPREAGTAQDRRNAAVAHRNLAEVLTAKGDTLGAVAEHRASQAVLIELLDASPGTPEWKRDLKITHEKLADVLSATGDSAGAIRESRAALELARQLAASEPSPQAQRDLSVSHNVVGTALRDSGDLPGALAAYRAGLELQTGVAAVDPANLGWQRDLMISHLNVSSVLTLQGEGGDARANAEAALAVSAQLRARDPHNRTWQRDHAVVLARLGAIVATSDPRRALDLHERYLAQVAQLAAEDPLNAATRRDLAIAHGMIGTARRALGDVPGAITALTAGREVTTALLAGNPGNAELRRDLWEFRLELGKAHLSLRAFPEAIAELRGALQLALDIAADDPSSARQVDVATSRAALADAVRVRGE